MARGEYPSDKQDQYMVRFPEGMRDRIKGAADINKRSMNAEIVARLEASFNPPETSEHLAAAAREVEEMRERLAKQMKSLDDLHQKMYADLKERSEERRQLTEERANIRKELQDDFDSRYERLKQELRNRYEERQREAEESKKRYDESSERYYKSLANIERKEAELLQLLQKLNKEQP